MIPLHAEVWEFLPWGILFSIFIHSFYKYLLKDEAKVVFDIDKALAQKELTLMQETAIKKNKNKQDD